MTLTLDDAQIQKLEAAILEVPGKYSIPLIQMLTSFLQENQSKVAPPEPEE